VSDQQPTFHINIDDYISVLGIQALADAFISAMQRIIDAEKEVTVDELLYAFLGNLQDDATDHWLEESEEDLVIKAEFNGEKITYKEYKKQYGFAPSMNVEFYHWNEKKLMEPDLLYYVKLTIENSDYPHKEKLLKQINLRG
jgi:hypothetical protein